MQSDCSTLLPYISLKLLSTWKGFQSDRNGMRLNHGKSNFLGFIAVRNTRLCNKFYIYWLHWYINWWLIKSHCQFCKLQYHDFNWLGIKCNGFQKECSFLNCFIDINVDFAVVNWIAHTQKCVNNQYSKHDQFKLFRPLSRCLFAFLFNNLS